MKHLFLNDNDIKKSTLHNLLNEMGYNLKKVNKTKLLKKIDETDAIFDNVHRKKEEVINDEHTALISLDTKDKVLIRPFSKNGKNRIQVEAVDHELTNNCLIPFGPDNSSVRTIWLKGLVNVSKKYNITIELIYYPLYHLKYNPVERLWARIENMWNGFLLTSVDICLNFMKNLTWKNVKSITKLKETKYEKGMKAEKQEMIELENKHILRTEEIRKWNVLISL